MEVYKCNLCGNIVEVKHAGGGTLVCCGESMNLLNPLNAEGAGEKHVPVIEKTTDGYKVTVGEVAHPMTEDHYIEWIEILAGNEVYTCYLTPDDKPVAVFNIKGDEVSARAYCNKHGHWQSI